MKTNQTDRENLKNTIKRKSVNSAIWRKYLTPGRLSVIPLIVLMVISGPKGPVPILSGFTSGDILIGLALLGASFGFALWASVSYKRRKDHLDFTVGICVLVYHAIAIPYLVWHLVA